MDRCSVVKFFTILSVAGGARHLKNSQFEPPFQRPPWQAQLQGQKHQFSPHLQLRKSSAESKRVIRLRKRGFLPHLKGKSAKSGGKRWLVRTWRSDDLPEACTSFTPLLRRSVCACGMNDAELIAFGVHMRGLVYPRTYDFRGKPSVSAFSIQLDEARLEWLRRNRQGGV